MQSLLKNVSYIFTSLGKYSLDNCIVAQNKIKGNSFYEKNNSIFLLNDESGFTVYCKSLEKYSSCKEMENHRKSTRFSFSWLDKRAKKV